MIKSTNYWIFQRHTSKIDLLLEVAQFLVTNNRVINNEILTDWTNELKNKGLYLNRNNLVSLTTIKAKIDQLCFYMFGYKDSDKTKFVLSPLGKLLINHFDDDKKRTLIFISMLFNLQYNHPHSNTDKSINLFPFRVLFKLFTDERLNGFLYNYEIFIYVMSMSKCDFDSYEEIINKILISRVENDLDKIVSIMKNDEHVFVNTMYEFDTYVSKMLSDFEIINIETLSKVICKLSHPTRKTTKKGTSRSFKLIKYSITSSVNDFVRDLLDEESCFDKPIDFSAKETLYMDNVHKVYSKIPDALSKYINDDFFETIKSIPSKLSEYARNPNNQTSSQFENVLKDAFDLFYDVDAKLITGPGQTDVECIYKDDLNLIKFNVEAKSTSHKLSYINSGRLEVHMKNTGAKYCVVVTPKYVPAARMDIFGRNIVILTSDSFSEYILQALINDSRKIQFSQINEIIQQNLGNDISEKVYNLTFEKYGGLSKTY